MLKQALRESWFNDSQMDANRACIPLINHYDYYIIQSHEAWHLGLVSQRLVVSHTSSAKLIDHDCAQYPKMPFRLKSNPQNTKFLLLGWWSLEDFHYVPLKLLVFLEIVPHHRGNEMHWKIKVKHNALLYDIFLKS